MAYAKTFWQSVQLLPPMESRLVSRSIKQRLKVAPSASQAANRAKIEEVKKEPDTKLSEFYSRVRYLQEGDEAQRLERLGDLREDELVLLQKHRIQRIKKEKLSTGFSSVSEQTLPEVERILEREYTSPKTQAALLQDLRQFEVDHNLVDQDSDSD